MTAIQTEPPSDADALRRALLVQRDLWRAVQAGYHLDRAAVARNLEHIEAVLAGDTPDPWREMDGPVVRQPRRGAMQRTGEVR